VQVADRFEKGAFGRGNARCASYEGGHWGHFRDWNYHGISWMNENQGIFHTFWEIAWAGSKIYFVPVNQCRDLFDEGNNFGANPVEGVSLLVIMSGL
jgi:hypothetical protein